MDRAPGLLAERFGRVSVVDLSGVIRVTSPDPVAAHLATHPTFDITCLGGILTCRR